MDQQDVVYFFIITRPDPNEITGEMIFRLWERSNILREYEKPERNIIDLWVKEVKQELVEKGIRIKLN